MFCLFVYNYQFNNYLKIKSGAASVQHITSVAGKLIASSHYASNLITLKTNKLEKEWQLFHAALQNRQKILSASCMFHKKADQVLFL
jgi:hypothetical protein